MATLSEFSFGLSVVAAPVAGALAGSDAGGAGVAAGAVIGLAVGFAAGVTVALLEDWIYEGSGTDAANSAQESGGSAPGRRRYDPA